MSNNKRENVKKIEARLRAAVSNTVPDVLDGILSGCDTQKGNVIIVNEVKRKSRVPIIIAAAAAAMLFMCVGAFWFSSYQREITVDSVISLDVNPSVVINMNQSEKVISVEPLNDEGTQIIGGMDFSGAGLDLTVNALIGSMLQNGYISELQNSILITVESSDKEKLARLKSELSEKISGILSSNSIEGSLLTQTSSSDSELRTLANTYGISVGKAELIQNLLSQNSRYTFESLAKMSINELSLLAASNNYSLENIAVTGSASDKAYIGADRALEIALADAGADASSVSVTESELDADNGIMVYEISFIWSSAEYEYEINALGGDILKRETDQKVASGAQGSSSSQAPSSSSEVSSQAPAPSQAQPVMIDEDQAKSAALAQAGLSASSVSDMFVELCYDDSHSYAEYDVSFISGGTKYEYEIDASNGNVVSNELTVIAGNENAYSYDDHDDYYDDHDDYYDDHSDDYYDDHNDYYDSHDNHDSYDNHGGHDGHD